MFYLKSPATGLGNLRFAAGRAGCDSHRALGRAMGGPAESELDALRNLPFVTLAAVSGAVTGRGHTRNLDYRS